MTEYREGQEVEVAQDYLRNDGKTPSAWRKAKIIFRDHLPRKIGSYRVQFPDGTRAVFSADHIRAVRQSQTEQKLSGSVINAPAQGENIGRTFDADNLIVTLKKGETFNIRITRRG